MKTYEEKTRDVLNRINEEKKRHAQRTKRIVASLISLCIISVLGFGVWQKGVFLKSPAISRNVYLKTNSDTDIDMPEVEPQEPSEEEWPPSEVDPSCIYLGSNITLWNNKMLIGDLVETLNNVPASEIIDIHADPYIDYEFVYSGKTLAQYYSDMCDEKMLPELLAQLLKFGDSLKYGTMLYEGTAPNGEVWAQSYYEEIITFFGQELLNKYIIDGEFLADRVQSDLTAAQQSAETANAVNAYNEALTEYYQYLVNTLQTSLPPDVKGTDGIILHMTSEEFQRFTANEIEAWSFSLEFENSEDSLSIAATYE